MDEDTVRVRAQAFCEAVVAGDMGRVIDELSQELQRNVGEVVALLPLPASEATVDSIDHTGSGYAVVLRILGESNEDRIQTRWKDRGGVPKVVEASHLSRTARAAEMATAETEGEQPAGEG
jgi:hypothetical protein